MCPSNLLGKHGARPPLGQPQMCLSLCALEETHGAETQGSSLMTGRILINAVHSRSDHPAPTLPCEYRNTKPGRSSRLQSTQGSEEVGGKSPRVLRKEGDTKPASMSGFSCFPKPRNCMHLSVLLSPAPFQSARGRAGRAACRTGVYDYRRPSTRPARPSV